MTPTDRGAMPVTRASSPAFPDDDTIIPFDADEAIGGGDNWNGAEAGEIGEVFMKRRASGPEESVEEWKMRLAEST